MTPRHPLPPQRTPFARMCFSLRFSLAVLALTLASSPAKAQLSFTAAIDLALRNNPRVLAAEADADRARAALSEAHDVYVPSIVGGSGLGYSYGFPVGQPSIYNFHAQSLVFSLAQLDYIRAARASLEAANLALMDMRQTVAEETALGWLSLDSSLQRDLALDEQARYSNALVTIVEQRVDAGIDTPLDLTGVRIGNAQIRLARLRNDDGTEYDRAHLARLVGLPQQGLTTDHASAPPASSWDIAVMPADSADSPGIQAAYANAVSKQRLARGDARYEFRPQIGFGAQYNRFAAYNGYSYYYNHFQQNNAEIGVQITLPIFDLGHRAHARQSAADAVHALHDADQQRSVYLDGRLRLRHATEQLKVQLEIAGLDQQLAQQQLDVTLFQLQNGNGNLTGRQTTPREEQNSRITERDRYIGLLNATLQLRQSQINLLRQSGQLESWVKSLVAGK